MEAKVIIGDFPGRNAKQQEDAGKKGIEPGVDPGFGTEEEGVGERRIFHG